MLRINTSYSICQWILKWVFFLEVCLSVFHQQSDSYSFLLKVLVLECFWIHAAGVCHVRAQHVILIPSTSLSCTPFLRLFGLLWKTKVWLVFTCVLFFVLPRGYSSESCLVPDSAGITSFAQLLGSVKDAIRPAQHSGLWNAGLPLSWSLKGSSMYSQTQKISPSRLMDAFLFRFASTPLFTGHLCISLGS